MSIFPPRRIANVVALVFNGPMSASMIMKVGGGHFFFGSTGNDPRIFSPNSHAVESTDVAPDTSSLPSIREIDTVPVRDPCRPLADPAVSFLCDVMVRCVPE